MRPIGYHISGGQNLGTSLWESVKEGFTAAQIFLGPPQRFQVYDLPESQVNLFKEIKQNSNIKVYVHAPYVLHLFSKPENKVKNDRIVRKLFEVSVDLGCDGFILHMGGTKWFGPDQYLEVAQSLLDRVGKELLDKCPLLFENCASGNKMSGSLEEIIWLIEKLAVDKYNVGLCLDTLHAWAWGYDYCEQQGMLDLLAPRRRELGGIPFYGHVPTSRWLKLLHLNSGPEKSTCGSKYDRHECLSKGIIPKECFQEILKSWKDVPVIIEGHNYSDIQDDCEFVRSVDVMLESSTQS